MRNSGNMEKWNEVCLYLEKGLMEHIKICENNKKNLSLLISYNRLNERNRYFLEARRLVDFYNHNKEQLENNKSMLEEIKKINHMDDEQVINHYELNKNIGEEEINEFVNLKISNGLNKIERNYNELAESINSYSNVKNNCVKKCEISWYINVLSRNIEHYERNLGIFDQKNRAYVRAMSYAREVLQDKLNDVNTDINDSRQILENKFEKIGGTIEQLENMHAEKDNPGERILLEKINTLLKERRSEIRRSIIQTIIGPENRNEWDSNQIPEFTEMPMHGERTVEINLPEPEYTEVPKEGERTVEINLPEPIYTKEPRENERTIEIIPLPAYTNNLELNNISNNVPYGQNSNATETITNQTNNNLNESNDRNLEVENPSEAPNNTTHFRRLI